MVNITVHNNKAPVPPSFETHCQAAHQNLTRFENCSPRWSRPHHLFRALILIGTGEELPGELLQRRLSSFRPVATRRLQTVGRPPLLVMARRCQSTACGKPHSWCSAALPVDCGSSVVQCQSVQIAPCFYDQEVLADPSPALPALPYAIALPHALLRLGELPHACHAGILRLIQFVAGLAPVRGPLGPMLPGL